MKITVEFFKSLLLMVGYTGARSPKNGQREEGDSYGKQHRKAGEKYKKKFKHLSGINQWVFKEKSTLM